MKRSAQAIWSGALRDGKGSISLQSGALREQPYSFRMRFEDESGRSGTNPEELIAAAHASCFAMQLSHFLAEAGHPAGKLDVTAEVSLEQGAGGFSITGSALTLRGRVPGMDEATFRAHAEKAKANCPVSKALGAISITLDARLES
ncbi:MAG: OsmC family protein [Pseudomonadota bacterium]|jgi:osmotically inducible protein OsmC|nr:MAG: OsmC family peroxiredoxin [Pseudomonadota bacterium]